MRRRAIAIALTLALTGTVAHAGIVPDIMFDPSDGRFDTSRWLMQRNGFLPVPIVITEPAVGYGGGVGLLFFHDRKGAPTATEAPDDTAASGKGEAPESKQPAKPAPPSVSGVVAGATENGTWFAGAGHLGIWKNDNIRSQTGAIAMEVHLDFYGGGELPQFPEGLGYSMKGWGVLENLMLRLKGSDYWAGVQALHLDADTHLESGASPPVVDQFQGKVTNSAVGAILERDTRDNIFSPNTGWDATARMRWHWGEFLGDFTYTEMDLKSRYYFTAGQDWHFAWKLDSSFTNGDVPFYALPAINLRGIAKQRYQGESVAMTEFEGRYSIDERWSVLGFAGVGRASDKGSDLGSATDRFAGGAGFRYLLARLLGLQAGIDIARGPEEWAFYLQVGSAWTN